MQLDTDREEHENRKDGKIELPGELGRVERGIRYGNRLLYRDFS